MGEAFKMWDPCEPCCHSCGAFDAPFISWAKCGCQSLMAPILCFSVGIIDRECFPDGIEICSTLRRQSDTEYTGEDDNGHSITVNFGDLLTGVDSPAGAGNDAHYVDRISIENDNGTLTYERNEDTGQMNKVEDESDCGDCINPDAEITISVPGLPSAIWAEEEWDEILEEWSTPFPETLVMSLTGVEPLAWNTDFTATLQAYETPCDGCMQRSRSWAKNPVYVLTGAEDAAHTFDCPTDHTVHFVCDDGRIEFYSPCGESIQYFSEGVHRVVAHAELRLRKGPLVGPFGSACNIHKIWYLAADEDPPCLDPVDNPNWWLTLSTLVFTSGVCHDGPPCNFFIDGGVLDCEGFPE